MKLSPILTPDGRPIFSMGGNQAWKVRSHRGFVVSLEYVGTGRKSYAAMVIWPESNVVVAGEGGGAWCISRRVITDFVGFNADGKCTGGPSEHLIREARLSLNTLGKDINDKQALLALVDAVVTYAPDLVLMPATPKAIKQQLDTEPIWEVKASIKETGKVINESMV
jgi:hypothetical protein